jgi:hypothetical protein
VGAIVIGEPVVWRRRSVSSPYVGDVAVSSAALRFFGREPATGLEVSLTIPFKEITRVRPSRSSSEELGGQPSVVLELVKADAVCLRGAVESSALPARLASLLDKASSSQDGSGGDGDDR